MNVRLLYEFVREFIASECETACEAAITFQQSKTFSGVLERLQVPVRDSMETSANKGTVILTYCRILNIAEFVLRTVRVWGFTR